MFASQMREKMEVFICTFEIDANNVVQRQVMQAPRLMIEQEFLALMQSAANSDKPIRVKLSREVPIYDEFEKQWIKREHSIEFANNAYISTHKKEDSYAD